MFTVISIDNKSRVIALEVDSIDADRFEDVVMKIIACAVRIDAASPVEVCEDSALNISATEPECKTASEE